MKNWNQQLSRRSFIKASLASAATLAFMPGCVGKTAADGKLRMGFIGLGQQSQGLVWDFMQFPNVSVVAGCDVYEIKRQRFAKKVSNFYKEKGIEQQICTFERYQDILANPDIDAVVIAVPDHWHAKIAIDACRAKKDVYLEKPLTFTIHEGQQLVAAVEKYKRVLQVGSQQRSDARFQHAVKLVQGGTLGKIEKIQAWVGGKPEPYNLPEEQLPEGLNWELWLGPLDERVHYNSRLNPPISLDPEQNETYWAEWRYFKETGGGFTTDWGAHMFDIAQWAIGMDGRGPIEIIPPGVDGAEALTYKYDNGVVMTREPFNEKHTLGVKFFGENGWVEVSREHILVSNPEWDFVETQPMDNDKDNRGAQAPHMQSFLDAVVSRGKPIAPVEAGHSTCTACLLGNIAYDLGRKLEWDPDKQQFVNDPEAQNHRLINYAYSNGYTL